MFRPCQPPTSSRWNFRGRRQYRINGELRPCDVWSSRAGKLYINPTGTQEWFISVAQREAR